MGLFLGLMGLMLAGCHKRYDPLSERRDALLVLESSGVIAQTEHAILEVSKRQVDEALHTLTTIQAKKMERVFIKGPMGIPLEATNQLESATLQLGSSQCSGCLDLALHLQGASELGSALSAMKAPMTWELDVRGLLSLDMSDGLVMGIPREDWEVRGIVEGLPSVMNVTAQTTLQDMVSSELLKAKLDAPFPLFTFPKALPFDVGMLEFKPSKGLKIGAALNVLRTGNLHDRPEPDEGWRIRLPADTLAGVVEALLLRQPPSNGFVTDMDSLTLGDYILIQLRLIRANRKAAARVVQLKTHIDIGEDGHFVVDDVILKSPERGWHTPGTRFLGDKKLIKALRRTLSLSFPPVVSLNSPDFRVEAHIRGVDLIEDEMVLSGDILISALPVSMAASPTLKKYEEKTAKGSSQMD